MERLDRIANLTKACSGSPGAPAEAHVGQRWRISMNTVAIEELRKIPYLQTDSLGDRIINLMPLWDGERWHQWIAGPEGLNELALVDAVEADYVGRMPANESDLLIPFVEFMWQRASFPEICPLIRGICEDFHNMGTSIAKLRLFFRLRDSLGAVGMARFAATELEYIVILGRTVFDLLQEAVANIWRGRVQLSNPELEKRRRGRKLPDAFSKMVLGDNQTLRTAEQMEQRFGVPLQVAAEYAKHAPFFSSLRSIRDDIIHGGSRLGIVFATEKGFCVHPGEKPFSLFTGWNSNHRYSEDLVSVLPWVASVVVQTIQSCNALILALASVILFPPEIAPGLHVFVRGPSTRALADVLRVHEGGSPWWDRESDTETAQQDVAADAQAPG